MSTTILVVFVLLTLMFRENASELFAAAMSGITRSTGWFLIPASNVFLLAALYLTCQVDFGLRL
jgi:choline-glycine betaine transporter